MWKDTLRKEKKWNTHREMNPSGMTPEELANAKTRLRREEEDRQARLRRERYRKLSPEEKAKHDASLKEKQEELRARLRDKPLKEAQDKARASLKDKK